MINVLYFLKYINDNLSLALKIVGYCTRDFIYLFDYLQFFLHM